MTQSEESIVSDDTLPSSSPRQQILRTAQDDTLPYTVVLYGARILVRKTGNEIVTQSEESITLMGSRIPYLWCCFLFSCI